MDFNEVIPEMMKQIEALKKRVTELEKLADAKEGRPAQAGHTEVKK